MSLANVQAWFNSLPPIERKQPLIVMGSTAYTPEGVLSEVTRNTPTGQELQRKIERREFTTAQDKYALALLRLKERLAATPPNARLIYRNQSLTAGQLLDEINRGTPLGRAYVESEIRRTEDVLQR